MHKITKFEHAKRNFRLAKQLETHKKFLHKNLNRKIPLDAKFAILESFYGISDIQSSAKAEGTRLLAKSTGVSNA